MDEQQKLRTILPATGAGLGALVLVLLIGQGFSNRDPLESARPEGKRLNDQLEPTWTAEARLWEDPILALSDAMDREERGELRSGSNPLHEILQDDGSGLVIVAMLQGGSAVEASEQRLRQRIATISALGLRGFVPKRDGRLSFFTTPDMARFAHLYGLEPIELKKVPVAYEEFEREVFSWAPAHPATKAVVIWLDEGITRGTNRPREFLLKTLSMLAADDEGAREGLDDVHFIVLGPASSSLLEGFVQGSLVPGSRSAPTRASGGGADSPSEAVVALRKVADGYLDAPLSSSALALMEGLNPPDPSLVGEFQDLVSNVIIALENLNISDSNPQWERSVVNLLWLPRLPGIELQDIDREDIDRATASVLDELVMSSHSYLDDGLNSEREGKLRDSVEYHLESFLSDNLDTLKRAIEAAETVLATIDHVDSDPDWRDVVAWRWVIGGGEPTSTLRNENERVDSYAAKIEEHLRIYSSRATAPPSLFTLEGDAADLGGSCGEELNAKLAESKFFNVVSNDGELAELLIDELSRRGVDVVHRVDQHIALISEWDTLYGRALPFAIEAEIVRRRDRQDPCREQIYRMRRDQSGIAPEGVHRFSYLRGLDGVGPEVRRNAPGAASAGSMRSSTGESPQLERASGRVQLDQVRRVGDEIVDLERTLRDQGTDGIRAIGVLGSDFYDKELVLETLRKRFPRAVFFTTDLDARHLDPQSYERNRNLVVASSFGLELEPRFQCHIPPFRDTYATATFLATLTALEDAKGEESANVERPPGREGRPRPYECYPVVDWGSLSETLRPRLFEIGRGRVVDITPESPPEPAATPASFRLHPSPPDKGHLFRRLLIGTSLFLWVPFLWTVSRPLGPFASAYVRESHRVRTNDHGRTGAPPAAPGSLFPRLHWSRFPNRVALAARVVLILLTLLMIGILASIASSEGTSTIGEPLGWLDGVSIWPSELLRLLGICLALTLLLRAMVEIHESDRVLKRHFAAGRRPASRSLGSIGAVVRYCRTRGDLSRWRSRLLRRAQGIRQETVDFVDATAFWRRYRAASAAMPSMARVGMWTLLAVLLTFGLLAWLGYPNVPGRSALSRRLDIAVMVVSTLALLVLTFFVWDAIRLCSCFVRSLTMGRTRWAPTPANIALEREIGVGLTDLAEVLSIRLIASRTETIGRLVLYPFAVLIPLILSRSRLFDSWDWPWSVIVIVVLVLAVTLGSAVVLRKAALSARRSALQRLEQTRLRRLGRKVEGEATPEQLAGLMNEIRAIDQGAFAPWSNSPLFGALLLPFGGAGIASLLEVLMRIGS